MSSISCAPRERTGKRWLGRYCKLPETNPGCGEVGYEQRDVRDAETAGEARRKKPTSAPERTVYGGRCVWFNIV